MRSRRAAPRPFAAIVPVAPSANAVTGRPRQEPAPGSETASARSAWQVKWIEVL
jgi:hypothetical protein